MKDIMVDLETLGLGTNAVIISIGAVRFRPSTGETGDFFYRNVSEESCVQHGLVVDPSTVEWWEGQSDSAKEALLDPEPVALPDMCRDFRQWVKAMSSGQHLWGNGVGFDNTILRNAFNACGESFPIHFTKDMDVRTLVRLGPRDVKKSEPRVGTHHNALDDAIFQVRYCSRIWRGLKGLG